MALATQNSIPTPCDNVRIISISGFVVVKLRGTALLRRESLMPDLTLIQVISQT
jgi:hypothetical protein